MQVFDDDALILDSSPFRDSHLLLSLLTRRHGLQRGVWRRARRVHAAGGAATQTLSLVRLHAHHAHGAEMITCRQVDLLRSSYPLTARFDAATATAVVAELLLSFCPLGEAAERRFRLGAAALDGLLDGVDPATVVSYVQLWVLVLSGLFPTLGSCASCGVDLGNAPRLTDADGAAVCRECAKSERITLGAEDLSFLDACRRRSIAELAETTTGRASAWLDALTQSAAERSLRALSFFRSHAGGPNA